MPITEAPIGPSLAVKDLERARRWYADKLGWKPDFEIPELVVYKVGDSRFSLFATPNAGTAKNTVMNWNVDDLQAEVVRLRGRGVTFEDYDFGEFKTVDGVLSDPVGGKTAWFKDPDGNTIGVLQAPPGQGSEHTLSTMLAASDLGRAKAWYAEKLGFTPVAEFDQIVMDYQSDGTSFNVYKTEFAGTAKNTVAVWRMRGIRDEVARLRDRGVVFEEVDFGDGDRTVEGIMSDEKGDVNAWFRDSEGNWLSLAEDRDDIPA
jgi:catechol 2,3-dioxygenase-like lactoylglutathione lyase family enzyme